MDSMRAEFAKLTPKKTTSQPDHNMPPAPSFDERRSRMLACGLEPSDPTPADGFDWYKPSIHRSEAARKDAQRLKSTVESWAQWTPDKPFLTVIGGVGVGKSELAKTAVWKMTPNWDDRHSYYITAYQIDKTVKDFASAKESGSVALDPDVWIERLAMAEWLVIDDVGAGYVDKGWTQSRIERLIDIRYRAQMPTMVISNLSPTNLAKEMGERAYSRLSDVAIGNLLILENMTDVRQLSKR